MGGVVLMAGLLALYSALNAHTAVAKGALAKPSYSCISPSDAKQRGELVDHAFARAIAAHDLPEGTGSTEWNIRLAFGYIGSQLAFDSEERRDMILPALEGLPLCSTSE